MNKKSLQNKQPGDAPVVRQGPKTLWDMLVTQSWSFCKYLPDTGIIIQGKATVVPVPGKSAQEQVKWHEEGSWVSKDNHVYRCAIVHEYVRQGEAILIYAGPHRGTLLHAFSVPATVDFPVVMEHTHECGNDRYACQWRFVNAQTFEFQYRVTGPKKHYRIEALYTANQ